MIPDSILTGPHGVIFGSISSFKTYPILHRKGNAKNRRHFSETKIILEVTLEQKIKQALERLRNTFGYHSVQRLTSNILRITILMHSKIFNQNSYFQARKEEIQNALASSRQPRRRKKRCKKGNYSPHTPALLAAVARA